MRNFIITLVIFVLIGTISSFAQYKQTGGFARLLGMGDNPYIVDPYTTTVNPAWAGYYPNFLFGDLGSSTGNNFASGGFGQFVSGNFHVGGGLTLGALLSRNDFSGVSIARLDPGGVVTQINNNVPNSNVVPLNNNFEVFGSYKHGNSVFGLGIAYATTTNEFKPAAGNGTTGSATQIGFNAGIITKLRSVMLDVGASIILPSASYEPAAGNKSEFSQTIIGVNARAFFPHSSKLSFVPAVAFLTASGTGNIQGTSSDLPSATVISLGIGANYEVGDFLFAGGPGFVSASTTQKSTPTTPELTTSVFAFPIWNVGVEWNMTDWFVARLGYVAITLKTSTDSPASQTTVNETIVTSFFGPHGPGSGGATVGVGFRLGNFSLDATVNEDVLRQGLNNIGGGGATFSYLSCSYSMP